jgi:rSAM/selenodomain-associated transferase 1
MPPDKALIVMGKAPLPGRVKTRLCPPLSPRDASALCACMLADTADEMASLRRVRRYLFVDPPAEIESLQAPPFSSFERRPQRGKDLGERMADAAETAFREGARSVTIIGADCPALSAGRVTLAFREIEDGADAVLGPAADGGFYLLGMSRPDDRPFRGIGWGAPTVLSEVVARFRASGTPFAFLPRERDIDVYEDLVAFRGWAEKHRAPACPRTRRWVISFFAPAWGAPASEG